MASNHTAEEVEQQYLEAMGPALGREFHALWNEVARLHATWKEYRALFGDAESTIAVLNETAPFFFRTIQDVLWEATLLHLSRVTDTEATGKYENLTLLRFPALIDDLELRERLRGLVERARTSTEFARDWRNRHIAHSDLALAIDGRAIPLKPGSRQLVEDALCDIRDVMNAIDLHYRGSTVAYEHFITGANGADGLLFHLRESIELERKKRRDLGLD